MRTGKRRRRKMDTPYARITSIKEAVNSYEANECLGNGFVLIKAVEKRETDALGRQASSIVYVLGKLKTNSNATTTTTTTTPPPAGPAGEPLNIMDESPHLDPSILENLTWKSYSSGGGEWTFVVNQDGSPVAQLEPAKEFLQQLKDGEDLVVGGYKYRLRGKFLKRYTLDGQSA